jgi:NAD(P)-dependent dehydrogenase (short-subunit alcohol dehydrogenase family)
VTGTGRVAAGPVAAGAVAAGAVSPGAMPDGASELAGRTALVTGAGNGLGRAIALALAGAGARVILTGRTERTLRETADLAGRPAGGQSRPLVTACDVTSPESVDALRDALIGEEVDVLVNNAGIGGPVKPVTDIVPDEWDEVFSANVRSVFLMCRAFLPAMYLRGSGDVINIASVTGKRPLTRRAPYAASKMAVLGLTRTLAFEAGPLGVRVNSLSPGPCRGERMTRNFTAEAAASGTSYAVAEEAFVSRAALRRLVEEDEVGLAVLAMLRMPGLCGADIDLSAGMIAPA